MKYRIESVVYFDGYPQKVALYTQYTDDRNVAQMASNELWFLGHYGFVINQETGKIEYEFSSGNPEAMLKILYNHLDEVEIRKQKEEEA